MPNIGFEIKRKCSVCGKVFIAKTLDSVYCSTKCGKVAYKRRKEIEAREKKLALIAKMVPTIREYISVKEAVAIYGVERGTLYRLIKQGRIASINIGIRLTRIRRTDLDLLFMKRSEANEVKAAPAPKLYSLEPEDCYTIGEICDTYHINDRTVWAHVRKYSIPSRQIGNYVYVPKEEIDNLYKSEIE